LLFSARTQTASWNADCSLKIRSRGGKLAILITEIGLRRKTEMDQRLNWG
jgi:hypothetical protein